MDSRLAQILAEVFGVDGIQLNEKMTPDDIESWDSLKHLQMITALEQAYGVQFDTDEISEIQNLADVVETLRRHNAL